MIPSISYMGIINLSGSCCTAPLRLEEIRRSTESQSSATLVLVQEIEWTCFQGDLTIDAESLDDVYDLTVQSNGGYNVYNSWQWNYGSMSANEGSQATCGKARRFCSVLSHTNARIRWRRHRPEQFEQSNPSSCYTSRRYFPRR